MAKILTIGGSLATDDVNIPLDSRSVVQSISDIYSIQLPYEGLIVYVKDTKKHYKITSLANEDMQVGSYEEMGSGSTDPIPPLLQITIINTQANWNEDNYASDAYIRNKPVVPTLEMISSWGYTKNIGNYIKPTAGIPLEDLDLQVLNNIALALEAATTASSSAVSAENSARESQILAETAISQVTSMNTTLQLVLDSGEDATLAAEAAIRAGEDAAINSRLDTVENSVNSLLVLNGYYDTAPDVDLEITDEQGNILASFEAGGIRTKNFDSTSIAAAPSGDSSDLTIQDDNGQILVDFNNGHIQTKNFDSSDITVESAVSSDLVIADDQGHSLAAFEEGHIKTKNFDSSNFEMATTSMADFAIADERGRVLAEFKNGHIKTKNFDSSNISVTPSIPSGDGSIIVNPYAGKRLSILGDSISTFGTPDLNNSTGTWTYAGNRCRYPQANLLTDVNKCYWKKLIDNLGMTLGVNESWAGSRVSNTSATDSGDLGPNRCIASTTRIRHLGDRGVPDVILIYAGTNDIGGNVTIGTFDKLNPKNYSQSLIDGLGVTTFADAYRTMIVRLQYYYPNSKLFVVLPNFTTDYYTIVNLDLYNEVVKEICDFYGVEYVDIRTCGINIFNKSTYLPDGIHPNAAGMNLIYECIKNALVSERSSSGSSSNILANSWIKGKNVAILGDSISTNGNSGTNHNVPEITITSSDVGKTLNAYVTYWDVLNNLSINGHTYTDSEIGTKVTFTPTQNDVGKSIGLPDNYNASSITTWWETAMSTLGFNANPVCWSGSSITLHEASLDKYKCSYAWHESLIRKCGIRTAGTMTRTAPDVIVIYRGTNDMTHTPYTKLTSGYFDNGTFTPPTTDIINTSEYGFKLGYVLLIEKLRQAYPLAKIVLCTLTAYKRNNKDHFPSNNGINTLPLYNNAIREVANYMGCDVIEFDKCGITYENCYPTYIQSLDSANPTHPNDAGHALMAKKAIQTLSLL